MLSFRTVAPNFQANGKLQGDHFEAESIFILRQAGFEIHEPDDLRVVLPDAGVEVDIIALNLVAAISFFITCKGSYQGDRPGCERTDTLKKAMAEALALHVNGWGPVLLLTSHLPSTKTGIALLRSIAPDILFDAIEPASKLGIKRLSWLAKATESQLRRDLAGRQAAFAARAQVSRNPLS